MLTSSLSSPKKSSAATGIVKLSACLRFFAEGGYQTGVGKDHEVGLAQSSFSVVLSQVLVVLEEKLCPQWINILENVEEKRKVALSFLDIPKFFLKKEAPCKLFKEAPCKVLDWPPLQLIAVQFVAYLCFYPCNNIQLMYGILLINICNLHFRYQRTPFPYGK